MMIKYLQKLISYNIVNLYMMYFYLLISSSNKKLYNMDIDFNAKLNCLYASGVPNLELQQ